MKNTKNSTKQPVFIVCSKDEYEFVWKHLHEIIDTSKQQLIIPLGFVVHEEIKNTIDEMANEFMTSLPKLSKKDAGELATNEWLNKKLQHFQTYAEDAEVIIILQNDSFSSDALDVEEKNMEINHTSKLKKPISYINTRDLEDKVLKKTTK